MKIRTKIFLTSLSFAFLFVFLSLIFLNYFFVGEFLKLEEREAKNNIEEIKSLIEKDVYRLNSNNKDWAYWDDTYYFVLGQNKNYIESNINYSTIENLDLDFITYLNNKKEIIFSFGIDRKTKGERNFDDLIKNLISNKDYSLLKSYKGIFSYKGSFFLLSSEPILKSDKTGPSVGALIFGRTFGERELREIIEVSKFPLRLEIKEKNNPEGNKEKISIERKTRNNGKVYYILEDIFEKPSLVLEIEFKREIYNRAISSFWILLSLVFIISILAVLFFSLIINKNIIRRLEFLAFSLKKARLAKEPAYISFLGKDEIDTIADKIKEILLKKKFSKEEIWEIESEYQKIFELSPESISVLDKKGRIIDINERIFDWLGFKREEVLGKSILTVPFLPRKSKLIAMSKLSQRMLGKEVPPYDLEFLTKDKKIKIGRVRGAPLPGKDGKIDKEIVLIEDVTDLREAEKKLKESEENFRRIFDSAQDGIFTLDLRGRFISGNKKAEEICGYKKEELIGKSFVELLPKKEIPKVLEIFNNLILGKISFHKTEIEIIRKDGKIIPIELVGNILKKGKNIIGVEGIARDISERKEAERRLKIAKEKLEKEKAKDESIIDNIGEGLIVLDKFQKILVFNKGAEELIGYNSEDVIGKNFNDVILIEDDKEKKIFLNQEPFSKAFLGRKIIFTPVNSKYFIRSKDNKKIPISLILSPILMEGEIIGVILIFNDISKEKEVDRAKSEFVSLASHQLRTPLTTIKWYVESLLSEDLGALNNNQKQYLHDVYIATQRMITLIKDLLNVSRLEMGNFQISPSEFSIKDLINEVLKEFLPKIKNKEIKFKKYIEKGIPKLFLDFTLLRIVFQNLISNAIKYTKKGDRIEIKISKRSGGKLLIQVSDNGFGIPKKDQSKIFTKLFRADNIKMIDPDGTGLGLYLTKGIVGAFGGKIWFESEENVGTTFFVLIPQKIFKKEGVKKIEP